MPASPDSTLLLQNNNVALIRSIFLVQYAIRVSAVYSGQSHIYIFKILQVLKTNSTRQISCCLMKTSVKLIRERKEMQTVQEIET